MKNFTLQKTSPHKYIQMKTDAPVFNQVKTNCTIQALQEALDAANLNNTKVISARIIKASDLKEHPLLPKSTSTPFDFSTLDEIGEFADIVVQHKTSGDYTENIYIWLPLKWNERFLGCGGGGLQTMLDPRMFSFGRISTMLSGLINGFATAATDGGLSTEDRKMAWGLDQETGELDYDLIKNWSHRSLHTMTLVAKRVIETLYGKKPNYSYYQGASTGGRMGLVEAQAYPQDYDGVWSDAPATNFARFQMSGSWPEYVMNWHHNIISKAKMNAFRTAALEQFANDKGYIEQLDPVAFDPFSIVGQETEDGPITEADAETIAEIYQGPHTQDGKKLFYGLRPETDTWNQHGLGLITYLKDKKGKEWPFEFIVPETYVGSWVIEDPKWTYLGMSRKQYEDLFRYSQEKFKDIIKGENADLTAFKKNGGKLMMSHCAGDALVFADGTVELYKRICDYLGGEGQAQDNVRFYLTPAGSHCMYAELGLTLSDGMIALMKWVEDNKAPETLPLEKYAMVPNTTTGALDLKLTLTDDTKPYYLADHPHVNLASSSIYDETPVVHRINVTKLLNDVKEASKDFTKPTSAEQLTDNPLFG